MFDAENCAEVLVPAVNVAIAAGNGTVQVSETFPVAPGNAPCTF